MTFCSDVKAMLAFAVETAIRVRTVCMASKTGGRKVTNHYSPEISLSSEAVEEKFVCVDPLSSRGRPKLDGKKWPRAPSRQPG